MNCKLIPIIALLLFNISCQATTKQAHEKDTKAAKKRLNVVQSMAQQPVWITDPFSLFPGSSFITAVGTGNNYQASDDQARHEMASQFSVKLKGVNVHVSSRATESSGGDAPVVFAHSDSTSGVRTEVNLQLDGVVVKKRWTDRANNVYYSLAVLERAPVITKLTGQIEQIQSSILELQNDGNRLLETNTSPLKAAKRFFRAAAERKNLDPLIETYQFVRNDFSPFPFNAELLSSLKLENEAEKILSRLDIIAVSGNNQETRAGSPLPEPLVVKVVLRGDEETVPMKDIPLLFQYQKGNGEMEMEKITDKDGTASNKIFEVKETKEKNHLINVKMNVNSMFTDIDPDHPIMKQLKSKKRLFSYTIKKPKRWDDGILSLANQLISKLDIDRHLIVARVDFRDFRSRKRMPFSELIERDLRRHLGTKLKVSVLVPKRKTRDLSLADQSTSPDDSLRIEITGTYNKMPRKKSVRIYASMVDSNSLSMGVGVVEIKSEDIDPADLSLINQTKPLPETETQKNRQDDYYRLTMEWLLAFTQENPQFKFKVWTDKEEYKICAPKACDKVNIFIQSERAGYLYLFDIGTSGNLWMLFPNERMKEPNYIRAGKTVKIPDDYWNSPIWVHEPKGLERIKAILTPEPVDWGALDNTNAGFKRLKRDNQRGLEEILSNLKQLPDIYPDMVEATASFFIREEGTRVSLGIRGIKAPPPKKPMDIIGTMGRE